MPKLTTRYTNQSLAETFRLIADLLEIKGEVIYKTLAYRKAADSLTDLGRDINEVAKEGALTDLPGVGKAIAEKIDELLSTGKLKFLDKLAEEVPLSLADLLQIQGLGPKKVGLFWRELGITTLDELKAAAEAGKLRGLPGMGAKSEEKILAGIAALARRSLHSGRKPLGVAWPFAQDLLVWLRTLPGVTAAEAAGSLRRMKDTVGDLDILAAAADSEPVMQAFVERADVLEILGHGPTKSSVEFTNGLRAQLWVHPPERFGTALQYATGSKDHNVRLRELALDLGYSLSEHALKRTDDESEITCATEEEVYQTLGLPWIPPELREDRGEVQAATAGALPALITQQDRVAELHCHSSWSDGKATVREMAQGAAQRGLKLIVISDHSQSLGIANGLSVERLHRQRAEIEAVQAELGDTIRILQGSEVEIKADGTLDFPDDVLAELDLVVASLHTSLGQPREQVTQRLINAIQNPHVDIIGHPTGRMIPDREGADLDMDAVLAAAVESGVALEINAHPSRLDLNDIYARRAAELGIPLSINTDAHAPQHFDLIYFGIATARRAWITPEQVLNCRDVDEILNWLRNRR
ncbi:MAG: DNA polymerase/3'-5' exonuclease PolX [Chloroflexi bacterium]|nr:DNA polymerase/3'-5' exonuclease PolX [Chloroflexota bacterium]